MCYQSEDISRPLTFRTLRGEFIAVRRAMATDTVLLGELLFRVSERTLQLRYMRSGGFSADMFRSEALRLAQGSSPDRTTFLATIRLNHGDEAVAVAELARDHNDPSFGEIALFVRDDEQRQGIGAFLLRHLIATAQRSAITRLSASMLAENRVMLHLICGLGLPYTLTTHYGATEMLVLLPQDAAIAKTLNLQPALSELY